MEETMARAGVDYGRTRSVALKAAITALALTLGAAGAASAADVFRVGKAVPEAFSFVPVDVGIRTGIFAKHGLDVKATAFHGDAKMQQAAVAGSIDILLGSGPAMAFIAKGSPIKAVGALTGAPSLMTIVVKYGSPVKKAADLKGRKISVSTAGSLTFWLVTETSRQQGWGNKGIDIAPMGATAPQIAAMKRGDIDGLVTDLATALDLANRKEGQIVIRFGDVIHDFHTNVIFATDKVIAEQPKQVKAFLAGWYETIAYMNKHRAETIKISADVMHKNMQISEQTYDVLMPVFSTDGKFNPKALATLAKSYVEMKRLPKEPDMNTLINATFLP
jgi:ABC-type nitrate/sulfonate/bicarbonate transport system substrate-binding protein